MSDIIPATDQIISDLSFMVALNTENPPGNEMALAPFIGEALRKTGMDVLIDEYALGRANVVAKFHNGASPVFALNTHIDTVPAGDGWTKDPFSLTQEGDTLFGRGTCDCKGSLASMLEAVRILMASPESWSGTLLAVFVGDEEVASAGARHYARDCGKIDYVIVGEPTSNTVFSAHKGSLRPVVEITGVTAHSGTPELGRNAIYDAAIVTGAVKKHHEDVIRSITHPLVGNASLCITRVSGGKADNVVPDRCELLLDRRLVPGECEESAKADIINLLSGLEQSHGIKARVTAYKPTTGGATQTDLNNAVVQASLTEAEACGVSKPGPYGFQGACDLVHFREAGASGVVIGPGDLSYAHKPDEFVTIPELTNAVKIYVGIVRRLMPSSNVQANT